MLLRTDLLRGRRIAVTGDVDGQVSQALVAAGAELEVLRENDLPADEERVGEWARRHAPLHALVHGAGFGSGGEAALLAALDQAWAAVREVAVGALIETDQGGQVVVLAPRSDVGPLAEAARSGLENLARTLSVEWARYGVRSVVVAPGPRTSESEIATLVCFLVSEAGGYLTGCRLELGGIP